jgi:hypothetical protein
MAEWSSFPNKDWSHHPLKRMLRFLNGVSTTHWSGRKQFIRGILGVQLEFLEDFERIVSDRQRPKKTSNYQKNLKLFCGLSFGTMYIWGSGSQSIRSGV